VREKREGGYPTTVDKELDVGKDIKGGYRGPFSLSQRSYVEATFFAEF